MSGAGFLAAGPWFAPARAGALAACRGAREPKRAWGAPLLLRAGARKRRVGAPPTRCSADEADAAKGGNEFAHKFDPDSDTDAFGRDPRKETAFWLDAARNVLDSDEVQQAVAEHVEKGGDGLTDEQRAYMEFIKSMDESKEDS